jgi:hypothetical protein
MREPLAAVLLLCVVLSTVLAAQRPAELVQSEIRRLFETASFTTLGLLGACRESQLSGLF